MSLALVTLVERQGIDVSLYVNGMFYLFVGR